MHLENTNEYIGLVWYYKCLLSTCAQTDMILQVLLFFSLLLNVTVDDISVIQVMSHTSRCESSWKIDLQLGNRTMDKYSPSACPAKHSPSLFNVLLRNQGPLLYRGFQT